MKLLKKSLFVALLFVATTTLFGNDSITTELVIEDSIVTGMKMTIPIGDGLEMVATKPLFQFAMRKPDYGSSSVAPTIVQEPISSGKLIVNEIAYLPLRDAETSIVMTILLSILFVVLIKNLISQSLHIERRKKVVNIGRVILVLFLLGFYMYIVDLPYFLTMIVVGIVAVLYYYPKLKKESIAYNLFIEGIWYSLGDGVEKDESKAIALWKQAAELGYEDAIRFLKKHG